MKQYKVRPGTKGIAPDVFPWHTEIDELYIPGTVKTIGRTGLMKVKRIYLGCGCPEVGKGRFGSDRSTEIIRTGSVIPWEDNGEPVWSISTFAETERIYARAKEHPQKEHLIGLLNELKEGAQRDALFNCRHTQVKNGRLTPEAYKAQSQIVKDMDLLTMSGWIVKTFQTREEKKTVDIVLRPYNGVMCVTVLGLLHKLEKLEPLTDVDSSFTVRIQLPKELHDQAPFQAFLEILKKLFSWVGQITVTTTNEKCPYHDWYVPVGGMPVPTENNRRPEAVPYGDQSEVRLYCRKCGTRLPLDSMYCYRCGTKVEVYR